MDSLLNIVSQHPYAGLFLMLLLGGIGMPVPEDATLILGGFLAAQDIVSPLPGLAVLYPGLLIADSLLYSFGRRFGRSLVERKRFRRILPPERLSELEAKFGSKGSYLILFGRHIAGLRVQLFLAAGVLRMPYRTFLFADALSALFTMAVMTGIGYAGGSSLQVVQKDLSRIEHLAVVVLLGAVTLFLLIRYFRKQRSASR